jgi:hypothetical protein
LHQAIKQKFFRYLKSNTGKSFSEEELIKNLEKNVNHPYLKKYIRKNGGSILIELLDNHNIHRSQKNGEIFFVDEKF